MSETETGAQHSSRAVIIVKLKSCRLHQSETRRKRENICELRARFAFDESGFGFEFGFEASNAQSADESLPLLLLPRSPLSRS